MGWVSTIAFIILWLICALSILVFIIIMSLWEGGGSGAIRAGVLFIKIETDNPSLIWLINHHFLDGYPLWRGSQDSENCVPIKLGGNFPSKLQTGHNIFNLENVSHSILQSCFYISCRDMWKYSRDKQKLCINMILR